jgi:hypothetical protein
LYYADDAVAAEDRGAYDFLDDFGAFGSNFDTFENAGMLHRGEIIDYFRAALSGGARS